MFFDSFWDNMKNNEHDDDRKDDVFLRFQQHYLQQQQQHKRECLSDEVDSARSGGETSKKPKADVQQDQEKAIVVVSSGGGGDGGGDGATIEVAKRRRGRPPGSKNKPKPPVVITREEDPPAAMRPHVLEIPAGHDVAESLARFVRRRNLGVCVLAGTGSVANVALRQPHFGGAPAAAAATIGFRGRFEILSISAMFLPPAMASLSPGACGEVSISLAGPQGQVVGGTVAGPLMAAGTVVVVAAAFSNPTFHRLPSEDDVSVSVSVSGGGSGAGAEVEEHEHQVHQQHQQHQQLENSQRRHQGLAAASAAVSAAAESLGMSISSTGHLSSEVIWAPTATARVPPPPPYKYYP